MVLVEPVAAAGHDQHADEGADPAEDAQPARARPAGAGAVPAARRARAVRGLRTPGVRVVGVAAVRVVGQQVVLAEPRPVEDGDAGRRAGAEPLGVLAGVGERGRGHGPADGRRGEQRLVQRGGRRRRPGTVRRRGDRCAADRGGPGRRRHVVGAGPAAAGVVRVGAGRPVRGRWAAVVGVRRPPAAAGPLGRPARAVDRAATVRVRGTPVPGPAPAEALRRTPVPGPARALRRTPVPRPAPARALRRTPVPGPAAARALRGMVGPGGPGRCVRTGGRGVRGDVPAGGPGRGVGTARVGGLRRAAATGARGVRAGVARPARPSRIPARRVAWRTEARRCVASRPIPRGVPPALERAVLRRTPGGQQRIEILPWLDPGVPAGTGSPPVMAHVCHDAMAP